MGQIAIFLAEGFEEIEALTVVDLCRRAGIPIDMVSIGGSVAVKSSHGITVVADKLLSEVNFDDVDMIVLPGGKLGTQNLESCAPLMEAVDAFYESEKFVAAICAAPSILGHRGILRGRKACCYPGFEEQLAGALVCEEAVVRDGHVITGGGMGCSIAFALEIVAVFCGRERAEEIAAQVVYYRVSR